MKTRILLILSSCISLVVLFQNCGQMASPKNQSDLVYKISDGSMVSAEALTTNQRDQVCRDVNNWVCQVDHYAPGLKATQPGKSEPVCSSYFCVSANEYSFDTTAALSACPDCDTKDGEPGGRYNYSEIYCTNRAIQTGRGEIVISKFGESATIALDQAVAECLVLSSSK